ncbi:hypothetical protein [Flavobacterium sp.]|uniref:hypothetical protein n=1 Tax=Flavobacterium sp. TaxID=239 RepID=UPI00374DDA39
MNTINAQVGIGTTTPNAALDVVAGANNYGLLMPRVVLTATNVAAPVKNPLTGVFLTNSVAEIGTMVFNTNTTPGTYGVTPGLYFWDGTEWISQFHKYFETKFIQTAPGNRMVTNVGTYVNLTGLTARTFVAPYDGKYLFVFTGYLGASPVSSTAAKVGFVEGNFQLTIQGVNYRKYTHSESFYRSGTFSSQDYYELFNEANITQTVVLNAGDTCTINAAYSADADDNVTTTSHPHVAGSNSVLGNLCEINVMYIGR